MKNGITNHITVKVDSIFSNFIAIKKLDLNKLIIKGDEFKKTFESGVMTNLSGTTLMDKDSMKYLDIQLTDLLAHLLKPICKTFVFNVTGIWINKYEDKDYQEAHVHPGDFSFIIYYKGESNTVFNSPVKDMLEVGESKIFQSKFIPKLEEGDVIMFPSYLEHWVKPNSDTVTVSGNITIVERKG